MLKSMWLFFAGGLMVACPADNEPLPDGSDSSGTTIPVASGSSGVDPTTGTTNGTTTDAQTTVTSGEGPTTDGSESGSGGWNDNLCQSNWPVNQPEDLPYGTECHECLAKTQGVEKCCWIYEACLATPVQNNDGSYNWDACAFQLICPNLVYECIEGDGLTMALLLQNCLIEQADGACTDVCHPKAPEPSQP